MTNDPGDLARDQIETMIAERLITSALATTPASVEERFRNLDTQLAHERRTRETRDLTAHVTGDTDNLWTVEKNPELPDDYYYLIFPPKNDPNAIHPRGHYSYLTARDGRRCIPIGPITPEEWPLIQKILNTGNEGR